MTENNYVNIPKLYYLSRKNNYLIMEYIEGIMLLDFIKINKRKQIIINKLCYKAGGLLNKFHKIINYDIKKTEKEKIKINSNVISRIKKSNLIVFKNKIIRMIQKNNKNLYLHGDFSPTNIIITDDLKLYLLDFGYTFTKECIYYDIARFSVTLETFLLKDKLLHPRLFKTKKWLKSFLDGYFQNKTLDRRKYKIYSRERHNYNNLMKKIILYPLIFYKNINSFRIINK